MRLLEKRPTVAESATYFEPVLDSREAAALLGIHPKTLQRLARSGRIPSIRIGKSWAFRASALDSWLNTNLTS
jgi:excisionase family DNA binding protein